MDKPDTADYKRQPDCHPTHDPMRFEGVLFVSDPASGIYKPKAYCSNDKSEQRKSCRVEVKRDWIAMGIPALLSILTLVLLICTIIVANGQWTEMQRAADGTIRSARAAWANSETASDALEDNRESFRQTLQQMQVQSWYQEQSALAAVNASYAVRRQVNAMRDLADATQKVADTASAQLEVSERPWISAQNNPDQPFCIRGHWRS